jgi:hypothetical protein
MSSKLSLEPHLATHPTNTPLRRPALLAALALSLGAAGCFSSTAPAAYCTIDASCPEGNHCDKVAKKCVPGVLVTVSPATATIGPGASTSLSATVAGSSNPAVSWTITEGPTAGTLTPSGGSGVVFVSAGRQGTYHVVAASVASPTVSASATITVNPLQLSPTSASVNVGKTQQFTANGPGTWSVQESAGGTVSSTGLYTAPSTAGTYHVALANPATSATATVTVLPPVALSVSPTTPTVAAKGTVQLTATLTNAPANNTGVVWSVQESGGGTVTGTGLYTAPNAGGTFHVQVVSNADALAAAVATINVTPPPSVKVTPSPVALQQGKSQQFTAAVTSPPGGNSAVTWSVQEANGGSINSTGVYVAPNLAGSFHVIATLVADTTVSGSATITVAAGPPDASKSTIGSVPATGSPVHADGQESFLVTMVLKDSTGQLLPGASIALAPQAGLAFSPSAGSPTGAWLAGALAATSTSTSAFVGVADASGSFSVNVSSATAQTVTLTASTCFALPCAQGTTGDLKVSLAFAANPWLPASNGIPGVAARGITVDPKDPSRLYLATANGVFLSTDKGRSWSQAGTGLEWTDVTTVLVGPGTPATLYTTALGHRITSQQRSVLYASTDGGLSWTARTLPQELQNVRQVAVDPNAAGTLYAATTGLYRSTDGGLTWSALLPPPQGQFYRDIKAIVLDPNTPGSVVVMGTDNGTTQVPFLFGATDGKTFTQIPAVLDVGGGFPGGSTVTALARDPSGVLVLATYDARTFTSSDEGKTWTQKGGVTSSSALIVGADKALYSFCTCGQIFKSIDAAASWNQVVNGQPNGLTGLAVDPADSTRLYVSVSGYSATTVTGFGVVSGGVFTPSITGLGPPSAQFAMVAIDPASSPSLKVAQIVGQTLYRSADAGATWTASPLALPGNYDISGVAVDAGGLDAANGGLWMTRSGTLYRLSGNPAAWTTVTVTGLTAQVAMVRADPVTAGKAYVLGYDYQALYVTTDSGANWSAKALPSAATASGTNTFSMKVLNQGGTVAVYVYYRGQPGALLRYTDANGWVIVHTESTTTSSYLGYFPDATDPRTFYFDEGNQLYKTRDSFANKTQMVIAGGGNYGFSLNTDPRTTGAVWVGYYGPTGPAFMSSADFGSTWKKADVGLGIPVQNSSEMFFGSGVIFLHNAFHGLFRSTTNGQ